MLSLFDSRWFSSMPLTITIYKKSSANPLQTKRFGSSKDSLEGHGTDIAKSLGTRPKLMA